LPSLKDVNKSERSVLPFRRFKKNLYKPTIRGYVTKKAIAVERIEENAKMHDLR
jgi:hypothetical protein